MKNQLNFFSSKKLSRSKNDRKERMSRLVDRVELKSDYDEFGYDYFDNKDIGIGYAGYHYDGRYSAPAKKIMDYYKLKKEDRLLEIGCAKGYLLLEFQKLGLDAFGTDVSKYAIENAHPQVKENIYHAKGDILPFPDKFFDMVVSKEVFPHIDKVSLIKLLNEIKRVSKGNIFLEIQIAQNTNQERLIKEWDRTHKIVASSRWWDKFFEEHNFECDVHYKQLF